MSRLTGADFADALGVVLRDGTLSLARVSKRLNTVKVVDVTSEELTAPAEARWAEAAGILRRYASEHSLDGARVSIVVPREASYIGQLLLPAGARDNVASVVPMELDRIIPLPGDQLYTDHFVRDLGTVGEKIAVSVVAARRSAVEEAVSAVAEAGLPVTAVITEPIALADFHHFGADPQHDLAAFRTISGERQYMTICSGGLMITSHRTNANPSERANSLAKRLESVLPERTGETVSMFAVSPAEGEASLESLAPAGFLPEGHRMSEGEFLAVGAALGRLGESIAPLNLLPPELARATEGFGLRETALSAAVVLMAIILGGATMVKDSSISSALEAEFQRLRPLVEKVTAKEEKNRELAELVTSVEKKSRSQVLTYLREVTERVPKTVYLTTFRYKGDRIEIDGIADKASGLISILEASPHFHSVDFTAPITKYLQSQERFSLRMKIAES